MCTVSSDHQRNQMREDKKKNKWNGWPKKQRQKVVVETNHGQPRHRQKSLYSWARQSVSAVSFLFCFFFLLSSPLCVYMCLFILIEFLSSGTSIAFVQSPKMAKPNYFDLVSRERTARTTTVRQSTQYKQLVKKPCNFTSKQVHVSCQR